MTETIIAAIAAAILSPTAAWLMLKGKLDDRYATSEDVEELKQSSVSKTTLNDTAKRLEGEINGVGDRVDSNKESLDRMRGEADIMRDRMTRVEVGQNPVVVAVARLEDKLDRYMDHQEEHGRTLATHTEQIKTLFEQRKERAG